MKILHNMMKVDLILQNTNQIDQENLNLKIVKTVQKQFKLRIKEFLENRQLILLRKKTKIISKIQLIDVKNAAKF